MQNAVHKMDTSARYGASEPAGSSHGSFPYRPHNESARSYGANFSAETDNGNIESPYTTWNMNSSANNNWSQVEQKPVGRSIHGANSKDDNMMVDNDNSSFSGLLGATGGSDSFNDDKSSAANSFGRERQQNMPRLGLLGGGESSIMPPSANWSGSQGPTSTSSTWANRQAGGSEMGGDSNAGTPTKPSSSSSWAQAAGKGLSPGESGAPAEPPQPPTQREKEAQEMRMRAATSQGWGPQAVNQDTPWEVDEGAPPGEGGKDCMWRPPINNGTDIWENTLRISKGSMGGPPQPPAPTTVAPPWGHTPATNIGGHWGDDDPQSSSNQSSSSSTWAGQGSGGPNWQEPGNTWAGEKPQYRTQWPDGGNNPEAVQWSARNPPPPQMANWASPAATPKKEMGGGWEPPSPPPVRRPPPPGSGYDDGTAGWGNPGRQGKVSHWKDMPSAKPINGMMMQGMPPPIRMPGGGVGGNKPGDWSKPPPGRGGSNWQDMPPHRDSPTMGSWNEDGGQMKNVGGQYGWSNDGGGGGNPGMWGAKPKSGASWADGQVDTSSWLGPAKQNMPGWATEEMSDKNKKDWTEPQRPYDGFVGRKLKGGKPLCKDIVHASKQFRILTEYGYRKEDVENALRNNNMNLDDAAAELQAMSSGAMDVDGFGGRKVRPANVYDDMPDHNMDSFNPNNFHGGPNNYQNSMNFSGFKQQPPKAPVGGGMQQQISPAIIHKLLQQQQQQQTNMQLMNLNNVQPIGNHKFTTNAQLRHLVQQIQMAVQAGHLNAQILNQPLAPTTLQLLYQLLQQIKALSSLHQMQQQPGMGAKGVGGGALQTNVQIAQAKGRIANLQNQICAQQALFLKQQQLPPQQQQPHHPSVPPTPDIFKPDAIPGGLHSDFRDLAIKDHHHQSSRLNQWKSSLDKEQEGQDVQPQPPAADFSRAPGPVSGSKVAQHSLLEQGQDWSGLSGRESNVWSDSATDQSKDELPTQNSTGSSYLTDLVPEFEPGKPWKGTQMKNIEDDPHITPGSIARSPLSVNNIKDSNLFWPSKSSPSNSGSDVASSTWGYNPQGGNGTSMKSNAGWSSSDFTTESWGPLSSSSAAKTRNNPPPGLPSTGAPGWDRQYNATFLILKNLTPQIDGSTLKTLCMQHGPLQMFHLFLSRGVALVRYSSPEEARKAQSALDNCVLSNTTMLADIPSETEIQQYLQVSSGQGNTGSSGGNNSWPANGSNGGGFYGSGSTTTGTANWNSNTNNQVPAATSQLWSFSNSSLWGSAQPANDHDATTNPINYLPNDLLGGEPI